MGALAENILNNKPTVFIVDDNQDVIESLQWLIEPAGYQVLTYNNPSNFLKNANFDTPCCAILDVRMPEINGLKLQDMLKERKIDIPVIFMTGHGDIPMTVRAMKKGAVEFLTKPVNNQVLLKSINRAIEMDTQNRFVNIERVNRRKMLEEALKFAIERDEFYLMFQPIYEIHCRRIMGVEALLRWEHPEMGNIPPDEFISIAEEIDLMVPIGEWVVKRACQHYKEWLAQGLRHYRLAINLSVYQLTTTEVVDRIIAIIHQCSMPPEYLEFEVTETAIITKLEETKHNLLRLQNMGIKISVDDFGTGYSSLGHLKDLPVNTLKVDRSFVQEVNMDENSKIIIKSIITLARSLGLDVIAEGVESESQLKFLFDNHCSFVQGFYFSKPIKSDLLVNLLKEQDAA